MTQSVQAVERYTLAWLGREAAVVVGLAGLTALAARVAIPLPGTPVPATLQVAAVIFAGAACGSRRGVLAQLIYLLAAFLGAPVLAAGLQAGPTLVTIPTFGYLLAFPLAAYLAGHWKGTASRWLGSAAGLVAIHGLGVSWLWAWAAIEGHGASLAWALMAGCVPFFVFDLAKGALATWSAIPLRRRVDSW